MTKPQIINMNHNEYLSFLYEPQAKNDDEQNKVRNENSAQAMRRGIQDIPQYIIIICLIFFAQKCGLYIRYR